jgi:hypothetical protein
MTQSGHDEKLVKQQDKGWYDLFSRGARDWLRHNDKVRESVMENLPELISNPDIMTRPDNRTIHVPVKFLEHYRFRLADQNERNGIGQGKAGAVKPGDVLRSAEGEQPGSMEGGQGGGGYNFVLEVKVDDIVDWLWEQLELPYMKPKRGSELVDDEFVREGWDRRGVRSRLDRRRTMKEAIKRRNVQPDAPSIINDDLRFRQLAKRKQPVNNAVIFFVLDASSSMTPQDRKLAKNLFFWILQGLRRQYNNLSLVFIAHTSNAWEFSEEEFFTVTAEGGTEASVAFQLVQDIFLSRFNPEHYNGYLFYASDGGNYFGDRELCQQILIQLGQLMNFMGYAEISQYRNQSMKTEMGKLFSDPSLKQQATGCYSINTHNDIWPAIKSFFSRQTAPKVTESHVS